MVLTYVRLRIVMEMIHSLKRPEQDGLASVVSWTLFLEIPEGIPRKIVVLQLNILRGLCSRGTQMIGPMGQVSFR